MVPGEKFSTTTSAQSIRGFRTSRLAGFFMSSDRLSFDVLRCANQGLSSKLSAREALTCTSRRERQGRVRDSTLTTSAPRSPRILVVIEPTSAHEKSSTRTPESGPGRDEDEAAEGAATEAGDAGAEVERAVLSTHAAPMEPRASPTAVA